MNIEDAPWLFTLALLYVFVIAVLFSVEIFNKTLIPPKWKIRAVLVGIVPLFLAVIIAVISMVGEWLYLLPEYISGQLGIIELVKKAYGYNNNLLIMIPTGLFYFIVLSISQNKTFLFGFNKSGHKNYQTNVTGDRIQTPDTSPTNHHQDETELEQEREELKRKDDEWRDACAVDDNYWNNWSNP